MQWVLLGFAVLFETIGTTALKASDGFTRLWPSLLVVASYGAAFYLLSLALRSMPIGIAYAIWSGLGICLIAAIGWWAFGQRLDLPALLGLGMIVAGIMVINLFSTSVGH